MENIEWSNEYFGLKNKEGKDVKIIIDNNPYRHPHSIIRVEVIEPVEKKLSNERSFEGWICPRCGLVHSYQMI